MKRYTKEELINMSVGDLMNIILSLQSECDSNEIYRKQIEKIYKLITLGGAGSDGDEAPRRAGRKPATPEERAMAYEKQKARQREKYHQMRALQKEEE